MVRKEILDFVENMTPSDHVLMLYSDFHDKRAVLFRYIESGLDSGEAVVYIASDDSVANVKEAMKRYGINVEGHEHTNSLRVLDYTDWYYRNGYFDYRRIVDSWVNLADDALADGFKALRAIGEGSYAFKHGIVDKVIDYEKSIGRTFDIWMQAICVYNLNQIYAYRKPRRLREELMGAHSNLIMLKSDESYVCPT